MEKKGLFQTSRGRFLALYLLDLFKLTLMSSLRRPAEYPSIIYDRGVHIINEA